MPHRQGRVRHFFIIDQRQILHKYYLATYCLNWQHVHTHFLQLATTPHRQGRVQDLFIIDQILKFLLQPLFKTGNMLCTHIFCNWQRRTDKAEYEILVKIKKVLVEENRHIRFGEWNANDIEVEFFN